MYGVIDEIVRFCNSTPVKFDFTPILNEQSFTIIIYVYGLMS